MGHIERNFRLTNEPGGLGPSCTAAGLSLAGVPLLQKTKTGFAPRPSDEIATLIEAAYGADTDPAELLPSLDVVAQALNGGDLPRAMIAAVLARLPELNWDAATRLAKAEQTLLKYDPDEPRDWHGRWTTGGNSGPAPTASARRPSALPGAAIRQDANQLDPHAATREDGATRDSLGSTPDVNPKDDPEGGEEKQEPTALENKYDGLGPTEFAKQVILFGDRLGREGKNLTPKEREETLAEYAFLQDRLSFWLHYDDKPQNAQANLLSAAVTLYEGAVNSGLVRVGGKGSDIPQSMVVVAGNAVFLDNSQPAAALRRPPTGLRIETEPVGQLGGIVHNDEVGINWDGGIEGQGLPWERYSGRKNPLTEDLLPESKTFDHYGEKLGQAISDKTLNTLSVTYIRKPREIYGQMRGYIDAAADYNSHRLDRDIDPMRIRSKVIQLAIPEHTSLEQWRYLDLASRYASGRGISLIITRIRE